MNVKSVNSSATQRAVLVTGASSGIGNAAALYLAEKGFMVFAGVRKEQDRKKYNL